MIYEVLVEDGQYVYLKVYEDMYSVHNLKMGLDEFQEWKKGKLEK